MTKVKKIGVLSLAKIQALTMAAFGLLFGLLSATIGSIIGAVFNSINGRESDINSGVGFIAVIIFPIIYGIMGFIAGALGAFVYNLIAGWVGGIELELENEQF